MDSEAEGNNTTSPSQQVNRVTIKPPPFWKAEPQLWFVQLEAQFQISGITADLTKYNYVISAIETNILAQVTDIIIQPPNDNKYETIKNRLISIYSDSHDKKLKKLLSQLELGDKKPSQLLNEMSQLGGTSVTSDLMKTLWLQRLPTTIQTILATSEDTVQNLAKMADKIAEIEQPIHTYAIASSSKEQGNLEETVKQLTKEIAELKTSFRNYQRVRSQSRTRPRSHSRNQDDTQPCWYHRKFEDKAKKCVAPCKYFKNNTPENK